VSTEHAGPVRVSSIELFFDLVFVYTVTQLRHLIDHAHGAGHFLRALVVLVLIWWIYAGYAWLTNGVGAARRMRLVLIAAAAGFLVMSQAIPASFGAHTLARRARLPLRRGAAPRRLRAARRRRSRQGDRAARAVQPRRRGAGGARRVRMEARAIRRRGGPLHPCHGAAPRRRLRGAPRAFRRAARVVIIIVLGESVVAIATGSAKRRLGPQTAAEIALSLVLIATLWWCYLDRDDERAEHAMGAYHGSIFRPR